MNFNKLRKTSLCTRGMLVAVMCFYGLIASGDSADIQSLEFDDLSRLFGESTLTCDTTEVKEIFNLPSSKEHGSLVSEINIAPIDFKLSKFVEPPSLPTNWSTQNRTINPILRKLSPNRLPYENEPSFYLPYYRLTGSMRERALPIHLTSSGANYSASCTNLKLTTPKRVGDEIHTTLTGKCSTQNIPNNAFVTWTANIYFWNNHGPVQGGSGTFTVTKRKVTWNHTLTVDCTNANGWISLAGIDVQALWTDWGDPNFPQVEWSATNFASAISNGSANIQDCHTMIATKTDGLH